MKVVIREAEPDKQHALRQQHGLHNASQGGVALRVPAGGCSVKSKCVTPQLGAALRSPNVVFARQHDRVWACDAAMHLEEPAIGVGQRGKGQHTEGLAHSRDG